MNLLSKFVGVAHAETQFRVDNFKLFDMFKPNNAEQGLSQIITKIVGFAMLIAALIAFGYLIVAGFQYMTAGGDAAKAQTARQGIVNALVGIIIVVIAYTLLAYVSSVTRRGNF
ncbi:hypothetical protein A3A71_00565 [Candidatus Berkelbacteria bacterium RIFCSPLOWO2_01_FULL_50_28]|uniref:Uncharacterized protein n=1 Tax=Candidatus Berkelbacteria bacterium RIFCSPLOWO2_01_FULL_50_28 TaxID=1797471 RepID=A0A1F5EB92_9BACT|nr:MAG: hypothetical protein A2807_00300 [Candidatus Berkelbacteria bacterium RIFCSPHIGHO2_01_FULL_50_36]OGD63854.1 MAG: hypothetical protein A3F39_03375 [Candidatus Berkelbacteria bacterium RIFCSPHIGHO2_12_FULL_50_11]OGD64536.1 MAG: hypothetical protein A3A71_00565 [Candidatus Berkelbacteria bacterium RIFCSPLOWO2_01_FULL_50_28]